MLAGPSEIKSIKVSKREGDRGPPGFAPRSDAHNVLSDASLFSSSLPVLPHGNCMLELMIMSSFLVVVRYI